MLLAGLATAGQIGGTQAQDRRDPEFQFRIVLDAAFPAALLSLLLGMILVTNELRHGTIARTLLATPRRGRPVAIKLLAGAATGAGLMLIHAVVTASTAVVWLGILDVPLELGEATDAALLQSPVRCLPVVLGGEGVVHSQVGALVGALVWIFVAEPLCWALLGLLDVGGAVSICPRRRSAGSWTRAVCRLRAPGMALALGRAGDGARLAPYEQAGHHLSGRYAGLVVAAPVRNGRARARSSRSRTAATAWHGTTASSSSYAAGSPAIAFGHA